MELTLASVANNPWPVTPSRRIIRLNAERAVEQGCAWVSESSQVDGAIAGVKHPSVWFAESQVSLLLFYCPTGGEGYKLMRKFADWVKEQKDVAVGIVSLEAQMGAKYLRAFKRLGFTINSPTLSYVRGIL